jgi:hypothetical protein
VGLPGWLPILQLPLQAPPELVRAEVDARGGEGPALLGSWQLPVSPGRQRHRHAIHPVSAFLAGTAARTVVKATAVKVTINSKHTNREPGWVLQPHWSYSWTTRSKGQATAQTAVPDE